MIKGLIVFLLPLLLLACGAPTHYQSEFGNEGYADAKLSATRYTITFKGNEYTNQERIIDFALLRAAHLTIAHDYKFLTVLKTQPSVKYNTETRQSVSSSTHIVETMEYLPVVTVVDGKTTYINRYMPVTRVLTTYDSRPFQVNVPTPQVLITIEFIKERNDSNDSLDANDIIQTMSKKYDLKR